MVPNMAAVGYLLPSHAPWWAYLILSLVALVGYMCRLILVYRLANKALDKADPEQLPKIVSSLAGKHRSRR
jgi:hypothetical protein